MLTSIFDEVFDIIFCEFAVETLLHIFDFLRLDVVIVVERGLVNELLIKGTFQKKVEVGHASGIVAVLVLCENRVQSEVDL